MTHHFSTPGVYIEEVTGPGVIAGVGTSTAAFIGPAARGPLNEPTRITSLERYNELFGDSSSSPPSPHLFVDDRAYYMGFGVAGFYTNGGQYAYVVRVGTAVRATLALQNQNGDDALIIRARNDGAAANDAQVEVQQSATQEVATGAATISDVAGNVVRVDTPGSFWEQDLVTTDGANQAQITRIQDDNLTLDAALAGAGQGDVLRLADIAPAQLAVRLDDTAGLTSGTTALISGDDAANPGTNVTERVTIQGVDNSTNVVTLAAHAATYNMAAANPPTLTAIHYVVHGQANINGSATVDNAANVQVSQVDVDAPAQFRPGDIVTSDGVDRAQVDQIQGNALTLDRVLGGIGGTLRIADLTPAQTTFRLNDTTGLYPGTVVLIDGDNAAAPGAAIQEHGVVQSVNAAGFVTLGPTPRRTNIVNLDVADGAEPILTAQEFRLVFTPPQPGDGTVPPERVENLSLNPYHPRYVFNPQLIDSQLFEVQEPDVPPDIATYPQRLLAIIGPTNLAGGQDDQPSGMTAAHYRQGLDALRDIDDVNTICIPDAASHPERRTIQEAMINHCLDLEDRFAILDSVQGAPVSGPDSVESQRDEVQSERGFAALYYPWLIVRDPRGSGVQPRRLAIPPSGHMAGVYARTDEEKGVHKAPANTNVRDVLDLETRLSDRQQGPLNLAGVNVLRIFPGTAQVIVWGARTTVDPIITDWVYVSTRRLLLYIEESLQEGIRWAVFEPNNQTLWKKLDRTITEFLTRVWRSGALFGESADKAFYVRIDEGLNPDSVRALGRLYIEIGVRVSFPAEFIIIRIGLWDGGAEISEL